MTTQYLFDDLERDEGLKLKPYLDTRGNWSIGIGHNLAADPTMLPQLAHLKETGITEAQARALFANDVQRVRLDLGLHLPWWVKMNDARQDALVNICFNVGCGELLTWHHSLGAMQTGQFVTAGNMLRHTQPWASQVGARADRIADEMASGTR